jgi:hypothetical protein
MFLLLEIRKRSTEKRKRGRLNKYYMIFLFLNDSRLFLCSKPYLEACLHKIIFRIQKVRGESCTWTLYNKFRTNIDHGIKNIGFATVSQLEPLSVLMRITFCLITNGIALHCIYYQSIYFIVMLNHCGFIIYLFISFFFLKKKNQPFFSNLLYTVLCAYHYSSSESNIRFFLFFFTSTLTSCV